VNDAELGGIVRALRHRRGWRQIDLASEAGVSAALVGLFERGRADSISVRNIRRIGSVKMRDEIVGNATRVKVEAQAEAEVSAKF